VAQKQLTRRQLAEDARRAALDGSWEEAVAINERIIAQSDRDTMPTTGLDGPMSPSVNSTRRRTPTRRRSTLIQPISLPAAIAAAGTHARARRQAYR
jgi:hypothetical protein